MEETEFFEGVRCALIEKGGTPNWKYPDVLSVPEEEINAFF